MLLIVVLVGLALVEGEETGYPAMQFDFRLPVCKILGGEAHFY